MSDHGNSKRWHGTDAERPDRDDHGADAVERYEIDGGVVFYDAYNPLAWVEATRAVRLSEIL